MEKEQIVVLLKDASYAKEAQGLADKLGTQVQISASTQTDKTAQDALQTQGARQGQNLPFGQQGHTIICFDEQGVSLIKDGLSMQGDFLAMHRRFHQSNLREELLVKASGILRHKHSETDPLKEAPFAVDATAGMGEDAFLLAAAGYRVHLYERDSVIAALLQDSLRRGLQNPEISNILERMHLIQDDSIHGLKHLSEHPDVILLDPMFPERQKSGLVKKKFQLLHVLERPGIDEAELFEAAFYAAPGRIIVKRPLKGPFLAGRNPSYSLKGKSIRYDCYLFPN